MDLPQILVRVQAKVPAATSVLVTATAFTDPYAREFWCVVISAHSVALASCMGATLDGAVAAAIDAASK